MSAGITINLTMSRVGIDALIADLRMHGWNQTADEIEIQLPKPNPTEPTQFGSVIKANAETVAKDHVRATFVRTWQGHWRDEHGCGATYADLSDVTVLRRGIGPNNEHIDHAIENHSLGSITNALALRKFADELLGGDQ